jgi:hypothetical protein
MVNRELTDLTVLTAYGGQEDRMEIKVLLGLKVYVVYRVSEV